jgi:hypothetical protein
MRKVSTQQFARLAQGGDWRGASVVRYAALDDAHADSDGSVIVKAMFSNSDVARDGHRVMTDGIDTSSFDRNPVVTWAHQQTQAPVAKVTNHWTARDAFEGVVKFVPQSVDPFGAQIGRLYQTGFLNAFSISWLPVEWKFSTDRARPGGIDFLRVDLLEIACVVVPCLPDALVEGRGLLDDNMLLSELLRSIEAVRKRHEVFYPSISERIRGASKK